MLRLSPESGIQMQLQLNLAWLHRSVFSVGKHGDAGGALLGSFPSKTSSPRSKEINTVPPDVIPYSGWSGDEMLLTSIGWYTFIQGHMESTLHMWTCSERSVPLQAAKWDSVRLSRGSRILNSACYLGQVGLQPSSERPSCLLLQSALPFNRLPRRMWKRPFSSAACRPFTRVYHTPALCPDSDATLSCFISRRCSFTCRGLVSVCLFTLLSKWVCPGVVTLVESVP